MLKQIFDFIRGLSILICFYVLSLFIVKAFHIMLPPAILGLVLFAAALAIGIIKEEWIADVSNFLIKNMAMFIVPFMGGLIVYIVCNFYYNNSFNYNYRIICRLWIKTDEEIQT